jgi:hypothetical protein
VNILATNGEEKPTPRAISERIFKIKKNAKANGAVLTPKKAANANKVPKTPTPRKRGNTNGDTPNSKRARVKTEKNLDELENNPDEDIKSDTPEFAVKEEDGVGIAANRGESRRVRKPSATFGLVTYKEDSTDDEKKYDVTDTDAEYAPPTNGHSAASVHEDYA